MLFKPKKRASGGGLSPGNAERFLREEFNSEKNPDLILRRIVSADGVGALLAFVNGMADERKIGSAILRKSCPRSRLKWNSLLKSGRIKLF